MPENFLYFAHLGLVLEVNWAIEVRNLLVRELADGLALADVRESADSCEH